jgi:hypothetical protein
MSKTLFIEPPCKIDDVIKLNFTFDNLHKFLNFLLLNDKDYFSKIQDLTFKMQVVNNMEEDLKTAKESIEKFESKFVSLDQTIFNFFQKFNELESKLLSTGLVKFNKNFNKKIF